MLGEGVSPRAAVAADDGVAVAWIDASLGFEGVNAAHEDDGYFASEIATVAVDVRVAALPGGQADVVWVDRDRSAIRHGRRESAGWMWTSEPLSFPLAAIEPEVVASKSGEVLIAWNQWTGDNWGIAVARGHHDAPVARPQHLFDLLSPLINFSNNPHVALNPNGQAAIAWFQAADDVLDTYVSERSAGSAYFEHPAPTAGLSTGATDVDNPVVALSADGDIAAVWQQALSDDTFALFLAERRQDEAWERPGSLEEHITEPAHVVFNAHVAYAGTGDLFIVFQQRREEDKGVFVLHRLPDGTWLTPLREPMRLSADGVDAFDPWLAVGQRHAVVAWTELTDTGARVVARRTAMNLDGAEPERWGGVTQLSAPEHVAGGAHVVIGGDGDRVACVWSEDEDVVISTID